MIPQLPYLGRDACKPAPQEDQVLFPALALHLCESLSVVLLLYPKKEKKKGNLHSSSHIQTKSLKCLGSGTQTGLTSQHQCQGFHKHWKEIPSECGLCRTAAGQRARPGSSSLCQKNPWLQQSRQSCKVRLALPAPIQTFLIFAGCSNQPQSLENTLCRDQY